MSMRFRKSVRLGKGARINLSKSGVGLSVGGKGMRYSVHSSGRRTTSMGIPGTGLSYVSTQSKKGGARKAASSSGMTPAQQQKLMERYAKKNALAEERRAKPLQKLSEHYAAGKIDKVTYDKLARRDTEVTKDLVIFGRGVGVKLGERYMLGKIDSDEFERLKNELLGEAEIEKDRIVESYKAVAQQVSDYVEKARSQQSDVECNYCGKHKGFFSPLVKVSDFKLCLSCRIKYSKLQKFEGVSGRYYTADKATITPDQHNTLVMNIRPEYILEYR